MIEISLWNPDSEGIIRRSDRIPDTIQNISRFQQVTLHQGKPSSLQYETATDMISGWVERYFLDSIKKDSDIRVERGVLPQSIKFDETRVEDPDAYPIEVVLQHLTEEEANPEQSSATKGAAVSDGLFRSNMAADDTEEVLARAAASGKAGTREIVRAKYMLGCDGAHSWTRNQLGYKLEGEQTDYIWYGSPREPTEFHVDRQ